MIGFFIVLGSAALGVAIVALILAVAAFKRKPEPEPARPLTAYEEIRRVLERDRAEWERTFHQPCSEEAKLLATRRLREIDERLIAAAEEYLGGGGSIH